jgi:hypothetical protein
MFRKQTLSSQAGTIPLPCKDGYVHRPKEPKMEIVTPASSTVMCSVSQCREKGKDSPSKIEQFRDRAHDVQRELMSRRKGKSSPSNSECFPSKHHDVRLGMRVCRVCREEKQTSTQTNNHPISCKSWP